MKTQLQVLSAWLATVTFCAWSAGANGAELSLSSSPLFLGTSVDPNVFFEVDDSGSMDWETLVSEYDYYTNYWDNSGEAKIDTGTWRSFASSGGHNAGARRDYVYLFHEDDSLYYNVFSYANAEENPEALQRDWRARSSDFNLLYYDPEVTYRPWPGMADASFAAAHSNPQSGTDGYDSTRDLTGVVFEVWADDHGYGGSRPDGPGDATDAANGIVDLWDSRTTYTVNASSLDYVTYTVPDAATMDALNTNCDLDDAQDSVPYEDCFGTTASAGTLGSATVNAWGRTLAEEKQNIANWYEYYRRRSFVAKAAIAEVMDASDDFRYGLSLINNDDDVFVQVPDSGVSDYSSHNADLLDELFDYEWEALGTPLRRGLETVGEYFDDTLYGKDDPIISECQQNFSVLLTDGYWSGNAPDDDIGDADGDGRSITVADVAKYYYDNDLSALDDNVPTSVLDDNPQQHMVTFTVAFGVQGGLVDSDNDGFPNPALAEDDDWGDPFSDEEAKIDDLWHAAFNSKGSYVAAQTPEAVVDSLIDALSEITDRVGSSASVASNSGSLHEGSKLFQARFDSADWSGQLLAYSLNEDGALGATPAWEASAELDDQDFDAGRTILSWNPDADIVPGGEAEGGGVAFRFPADYNSPDAASEFNSAQITALLINAPYSSGTADSAEIAANQAYGEALLDFLRGDRGNEDTGYDFRERGSVLGDLVDSDPQFVGVPRFRYPDDLEDKSYDAFQAAYDDRPGMVYVGANDGMLHGFAEADGEELLAYVPLAVYGNLPELADPGYLHRNFVNEAPTIVDVFLPNTVDAGDGTEGSWRTVLAGGLGGGGQAIYALDVTAPANFSEADAADLVLWEFGDEQDADLGYTYSVPSIVKLGNDQWAAVFGNGYNNTAADGNASGTGHAVLYLVDIETGDLIKKIDTESGSTGTPNGLHSPAVVDVDGDFVADYVYAGDLLGQLWKFDLTGSNTSQWDVAYKQGSTPEPLFTATAGQPITTRPQVTRHPAARDGYMVYFGTGKYLEIDDDDPTGATTQAFYGIWDKEENNLTAFDTGDLLQQFITDQYEEAFDTDADGSNDTTYELRDVSDNAIDFDTHLGWYIELMPQEVNGIDNDDNFGEKQISNAQVRNGRVIFTTLIPSQGLCDFGGSSFIMELDFRDGGRLEFPAFDLNGDGTFDSQDSIASGKAADVGIVPSVSILSGDGREIAYGSGSSGDVDVVELNVGSGYQGRQSWRLLR